MVSPTNASRCFQCPIATEAAKLQGMILSDTRLESTAWLARCRETLENFNHCLHQHLGFDAAMGVHAQVLAAAPECAVQVSELEGQHQRLLAESDALLAQLHDMAEFSPASARALTRQMENVLALFHRHEGAEVRLVREVLGEGADVPDASRRPCAFHHRAVDGAADGEGAPAS